MKKIKHKAEVRPTGYQFNRHEAFRIVALILIAVGFWCYLTNRLSIAAWQTPLEYGVRGPDADALSVMAAFESAAEGDFYPILVKKISRIGAPYYGNWSDFPSIEDFQIFFIGLLARVIGVFAAANAGVLIAQVLAVVTFYVTARLLDCRWPWACAGALAFGFATFGFARSIHHITVTNYWYVPLCLLVAWWVLHGEISAFRSRHYYFALGFAFFAGMQNPYYTNMFLQLVCLSAFVQYFRQGWKPVQLALGIIGAGAFGFFLMNLDTLLYRLIHGRNPGGFVRQYIWLELSALKPLDMLIPPPNHSFPLLKILGEEYYKMVAFPGEVPPSCYLGLIGIASLVWLTVVSIRRLVIETGRPLPVEAWQILWILSYAVIGGLNCLAGVFGLAMFRSTTRYCIFILPIVLLFAIRRLSRLGWSDPTVFICAGSCAILALWDQTPPPVTDEQLKTDAQIVDSDRAFTRQIEESLPTSAMVFQVPTIDYPEVPVPGVSTSDHFRPYLHSRKLRFSFGAIKGRPWEEWQHGFARMDLPDIVRTLEGYGFSAIYVNRNGYQDKGAGLFKGFQDLGYRQIIESKTGDLFCVLIHPVANPVLPFGPVQ